MTEQETEAAIGRLAMKYDEVNKKIACVRGYLNEHQNKLKDVIGAINLASQGQYEKPSTACAAVDWEGLRRHADMLPNLAEEKSRLEDCLRQAGLERLIYPAWK